MKLEDIKKSVLENQSALKQKDQKNSILAIDGTWITRRQFHVLRKGFVDSGQVDENGEKVMIQDPFPIVLSTLTCTVKKMRETGFDWSVRILFDRGSYHYRPKEKFTEYKADREYDNTYQCCWDATDIFIKLARELGLTTIQIPGLEADDLGMYYSYNSDECILFTTDSDWRQALRSSTVIDNTKKLVTYHEVMNDSIFESPFDLALTKAIDSGGHDNIPKVIVDNEVLKPIKEEFPSLNKNDLIFVGYKEGLLPNDVKESIDRNLELTRLDRILRDTQMHNKIKQQERILPREDSVKMILTDHFGEERTSKISFNLINQLERYRALQYG